MRRILVAACLVAVLAAAAAAQEDWDDQRPAEQRDPRVERGPADSAPRGAPGMDAQQPPPQQPGRRGWQRGSPPRDRGPGMGGPGMGPGGMAPGGPFDPQRRPRDRELIDPAIRELLEAVGNRFKGNIYDLQDEIYGFLRDFAGERIEELEHLRRENHREFARGLREAFEFMTEVEEIKREDPEQFKLMRSEGEVRRRIMEIERELDHIEADSTEELKAQRKELRAEMEEAVGKLFDIKIAMRKREVERLQAELERHEKAIKAQEGRKDELVKKRVREILGEEDDVFDW